MLNISKTAHISIFSFSLRSKRIQNKGRFWKIHLILRFRKKHIFQILCELNFYKQYSTQITKNTDFLRYMVCVKAKYLDKKKIHSQHMFFWLPVWSAKKVKGCGRYMVFFSVSFLSFLPLSSHTHSHTHTHTHTLE